MTENDKNKSIDYILSQGLETVPTARMRMLELIKSLGLRFIFWDTAYSMIFTAVTLVGALVVLAWSPEVYSHSAAAAISPLMFLMITLFAETAERAGGLYELKQTCYYTATQITSLRAMCYSILGFVFSILVATISAAETELFWSLLPLCLCVFFICACLHVSVMRWIKHKWAIATVSSVWAFLNLTLPIAFAEKWEAFLRSVPSAAVYIVAVLCAATLVWQIRYMFMEEKNYVVA